MLLGSAIFFNLRCKDTNFFLPEIFNHSNHKWWDEEELYGIADGSEDTATCQLGAALNPEPARWNGIALAHNAYDKANNSRHPT